MSKGKQTVKATTPIVAGYYRDVSRFSDACGAATAAGHQPEAFTPWPVHGLETKLGIPRSTLGRPVLAVILVGFALGLHLCWYTQYQDYPLNVGGKPYFAWQTFVVVIMETGLLLGALANMGIALHLCRLLPDPNTRLINDRITDDTFALVLPIMAGKDAEGLSTWLREQGAEEIQVLGVAETAAAEEPVHA
ncbi:MAG: DUF3341 domain-containing protein [Planctomycetes bacterium]|nr:DUF3341 domain-containing protein [Planctomycetota bacterium]